MQNMFSRRAINFDTRWGLRFKSRPDMRDQRPLFIEGRIATPSGLKDTEYFWQQCSLFRGVTELAEMLQPRQLQTIHDVSEDALPTSTDPDESCKGAAKFSQVGEHAIRILEALLDAPTLTHNHAIIFWDISIGVGNFFDAIMQKAPS